MPVTPDAPFSRRAFSLGALAVAGLSLSACKDDPGTAPSSKLPTATAPSVTVPSSSGTPTGTASASPSATRKPAKTITNLDEFKVTTDMTKKPVVTGPWPVTTTTSLNKVIVEGDGPEITSTSTITMNYLGFNAATGVSFQNSYDTKTPITQPVSQFVTGFTKSLKGKKIGSRVFMVLSAKEGYPDGQESIDLRKGECVSFVVDIVAASLTKPFGTAVTPTTPPKGLDSLASLPTVKDNGEKKVPTITIPAGAKKPTELVVQPLITGKFAKVKATDQITCNYVSMDWDTKQVLAQDYTFGAESAVLSDLVTAWKTALVNQPIGSRLLIIAPPSTTYPKGNSTPSVSPTATQVYVVDILFAQEPSQQ